MQPGVYRLNKDLAAIVPDRRVRHDWRYRPLREGTLFAVRPNIRVEGALDIAELYGYSHQMYSVRDPKVRPLLEQLEPVAELSPREYLALHEHGDYSAMRVLELLHKEGRLTLQDIERVLHDSRIPSISITDDE